MLRHYTANKLCGCHSDSTLTKTFPVVVGGVEKSSNSVGGLSDERRIGVDGRDGLHTLKRDGYNACIQ